MLRARYLAFVIAAGALATPLQSEANGRFPASLDVEFHQGDNQQILASMTFGLLLSSDDGATFYWVCEDALRYSGNFNPDYEIASDGTIFATTNGRARQPNEPDAGGPDPSLDPALRVSRDGGCTWTEVSGPLGSSVVAAVEIASDGKVWAATADGDSSDDIYISNDNGASFSPTGINAGTAYFKSLIVTPSDPNRAYITGLVPEMPLPMDAGLSERMAVIYRTINGGSSWEPLPTTNIAMGAGKDLEVVGVMPNDPDTVFLRSLRAGGVLTDRLYRSEDGGQSWQEVLEMDGYMIAFTITESGTIIVGTVEAGVRISTNGGDSFTTPQQQPQMACVGERGADNTMFSCGSNWDPDYFTLGRSSDVAQTWTKVLRFSEITAPLSCPPGTVQHDVCELVRWPVLKEDFGIGRPDAGPDSGVGVDAGGGGGGKGCCNAAFLFAFLLLPRRRRRALIREM